MLKAFLSSYLSTQAAAGYFVGVTHMPALVFLLTLFRYPLCCQATKYLLLSPLTKNIEPYPFTDFSCIAISFLLLTIAYGSFSKKFPVFAVAAMILHTTISLAIAALGIYIVMYC